MHNPNKRQWDQNREDKNILGTYDKTNNLHPLHDMIVHLDIFDRNRIYPSRNWQDHYQNTVCYIHDTISYIYHIYVPNIEWFRTLNFVAPNDAIEIMELVDYSLWLGGPHLVHYTSGNAHQLCFNDRVRRGISTYRTSKCIIALYLSRKPMSNAIFVECMIAIG